MREPGTTDQCLEHLSSVGKDLGSVSLALKKEVYRRICVGYTHHALEGFGHLVRALEQAHADRC